MSICVYVSKKSYGEDITPLKSVRPALQDHKPSL
jgi:hypothetical protein